MFGARYLGSSSKDAVALTYDGTDLATVQGYPVAAKLLLTLAMGEAHRPARSIDRARRRVTDAVASASRVTLLPESDQ